MEKHFRHGGRFSLFSQAVLNILSDWIPFPEPHSLLSAVPGDTFSRRQKP